MKRFFTFLLFTFLPFYFFTFLLFTKAFHSQSHGVGVGFELFIFGHCDYSLADASDAFLAEMLECDFAIVAVEIYTIICQGIAMSRQGVIGTAGIIAGTLTGIVA